MIALPGGLSDSIPVADCDAAFTWWAGLSESNRATVTSLCDPVQDDCFFGANSNGEVLPTVRGGRFIPHDDAWGFSEWGQDWMEYLFEHPEECITIATAPIRTFHICSLHPARRSVIASGLIPKEFACPLSNAECPMRQMLDAAPNHSLQLIGTARRKVVALPIERV